MLREEAPPQNRLDTRKRLVWRLRHVVDKVFAKNYLNVDVSQESERFVFVGISNDEQCLLLP